MHINSLRTFGTCLILSSRALLAEAPKDFPRTTPTPAGYTNLARVAEHYVKLLDENELPGLGRNEHGKANGYPLSTDLQKTWRAEKLLDDRMLADIAGCKEAYVVAVETNETDKFLRYFFCIADGKVSLVSAYHYPKDNWVTLPLNGKKQQSK